jgi:hypothetical protein
VPPVPSADDVPPVLSTDDVPPVLSADDVPPVLSADDVPLAIRPVGQEVFTSDSVVQLRLEHRAADHRGPDAVVHIPKGFDPTKPVNVVFYNHGYGATVTSAYRNSHLGEAMDDAPPNSILIMPEWQVTPGSRDPAQGRFDKPGMYRNMIQEIFDKTDGLEGKRVGDIASISIVAHSAGYVPTEAQLYKNGLSDKVVSITMLDATYRPYGLDRWLQENIRELHAGTKHFQNFFNDTNAYSRDQARRVKEMLRNAGLDTSSVLEDYRGSSRLDANSIARSPIVFKFSASTTGNMGPHGSLPSLYFGPVLAAAPRRRYN